MLFVISGRETKSRVRIPILPDRKKKCRSTKKQTDGSKNHEDGRSLIALYFVHADDGDGGDKKQT